MTQLQTLVRSAIAAGYSRAEIASRCGYQDSAIVSRWLSGKRREVKPEVLVQLRKMGGKRA